jgi:hypothetical protein
MEYRISYTPDFERHFKKLCKKYNSLPTDLASLVDDLRKQPELGTPLGFNLFKIRLKITSKGKGKSGGARVITYVVHRDSEIFLVAIYDKSEIENLTKSQLKALLEIAGLI